MSAYGTQKPGGQKAVQLTFPAVRTELVDTPHAYDVSWGVEAKKKPWAGDDFQALWHEQKKSDAHHMARAKVVATAHHRARAMSSHMGYFGMPKAVLCQRQNASMTMGAYGGSDSGRRSGNSVYGAPFITTEDMRQQFARVPDTPLPLRSRNDHEGLRGGVLRSAEGQGHARGRLDARFKELNQIDVEKQAFIGDMEGALQKQQLVDSMSAETSGLEYPSEGIGSKIELTTHLQSVLDALVSSRSPSDPRDLDVDESGSVIAQQGRADSAYYLSKLKVDEMVAVVKLAMRLTPSASAGEITEWMGLCNDCLVQLEAITAPDTSELEGMDQSGREFQTRRNPKIQSFLTSLSLFQKLHKYFQGMLSVGTAGEGRHTRGTLNERIAKSRALVQHLGFASATRAMDPREHHQLVRQAERGRLGGVVEDDSSDDDDSSGGDSDARDEQEELDLGSNARFTRQGRPREDEEHDEIHPRGRPSAKGRRRARGGRAQVPNNGGDPNRETFGEGAGEEEQDAGIASGGRGRAQGFFNEPPEEAKEREEEQEEEEEEVDDDEYQQPKASASAHAVSSSENTAKAQPTNVSRVFDQGTGGWGVATRRAEDGGADGGQKPKYMADALGTSPLLKKEASAIGRPKKVADVPQSDKTALADFHKRNDVEAMVRWAQEHKLKLKSAVLKNPTRTTVMNDIRRKLK